MNELARYFYGCGDGGGDEAVDDEDNDVGSSRCIIQL